MKWFKHMSDARLNLKLRQVIAKFGAEGYGVYWILDEIVADQGTNYRIKKAKDWKNAVSLDARLTEEKLTDMLKFFSEVSLIDQKALKNGDLFIPKLRERSDEYTDKLRRMSRQGRDNVILEENRREQKRTEENRLDITTPQSISLKFFSETSEQDSVIQKLVGGGVPEELARREIGKFVNYWTELNPTGRKQKWEMQKTFEVQRRLGTWFKNVNSFNGVDKSKIAFV